MPRPSKYNPTVLLGKTVYLQRIQEAVAAGYCHAALGTVPLAKAQRLVNKFAEVYGFNRGKDERYRRRSQGLANATLHLRLNEEADIDFALLVTEGEHAAHHLERLCDARRDTLRYREFELVLLTLRGRSRATLTWRWEATTFDGWKKRLHLHTAHYDRSGLYQDWFSLYRVPGFAGIRRQVGELVSYWRRDWQQLRGNDPCPVCYPHDEFRYRPLQGMSRSGDGRYYPLKGFPNTRQLPTLYYVRKQKSGGKPLRKLLADMAEHTETGMSLRSD
ncbi:MAG: hypothetical protein JSS31_11790 [Proteobacteria bacterium]|nr:hypothetical protein [Pseudomonadota bacterium]MBS0494612.1 hypothetical protein [Pseudomonadota bacterium]